MIIITRKIGQSIILNDNITITILNRQGQTATLGINAPNACKIEREEKRTERLNEEKEQQFQILFEKNKNKE